jgi:tetraacyldisaccharide 4'-kinase
LYDGGTRLRNELYDRGWKQSRRVPVPVVSVGNLTLGGTGKTPCVEYVARFYRQRDVRVAILSRGYGSTGGLNDEALVLAENLPDVPHLQGKDRVALAETAIEELDSEVLVLDDGFQHRRLARQLDLLLLDATNPWGHGHVFPRGLLRESPGSVRRAHVVILTRCDQTQPGERQRLRQTIAQLDPRIPVVESIHQPVELVDAERRPGPLERLGEAPVAAFCGLGNPEAFRRTLLDQGARLVDFRTYPDHHAYTRADVDQLRVWARRQPADGIVVTTQKDLVKVRLTELAGRELWALRIQLEVTDRPDLLDGQLSTVLDL